MLEERRKQEGIARTFLINTIRDTEQTQSKQKNVTETVDSAKYFGNGPQVNLCYV